MTRWELAMILLAADEQGHDYETGRDVVVHFGTGSKWQGRWQLLKAGNKVMGLIVEPWEWSRGGLWRLEEPVYLPASAIVALGFERRRVS